VTALAGSLAQARGGGFLDDAESAPGLLPWILEHPAGVLGAHLSPEDPRVSEAASRCLALRLPGFDEDPRALGPCLEALALEEHCPAPLPTGLARLPCPGNLRGLRNRLLRWKILGQLPEGPDPSLLPLATDDLAVNLHTLERILLHRALRKSYGNRLEAAQRLGVSRRHLYLLIARHGDPVRGEGATAKGPRRYEKHRDQNSSPTRTDR
jgi:hypothetical protein